jgi:hypothetical protein
MGGTIQNRYNALARELDMKDYAPAFKLTDDVLPVIVLHEHCENPPSFITVAYPGVIAATTSLLGIPVSGGLTAGAYYVRAEFSWQIPVAAIHAMDFLLGDPTVFGGLICRSAYGGPDDLSGRHVIEIPKMHVHDQGVFYFRNAVAHLAADYLVVSMFVQPV